MDHSETTLLKKCEESNIHVPDCVKLCTNTTIKIEALKLLLSRKGDKHNIIRQCAKDNEQNHAKLLNDMKSDVSNQWDDFIKTNPHI